MQSKRQKFNNLNNNKKRKFKVSIIKNMKILDKLDK